MQDRETLLLPGADQANVDGDVNGPKQCSHILTMALSHDLNQQFTLGAKYGLRIREEAPRGTDPFVRSTAHLGVVRMDYHVVHNWDIMAEARGRLLVAAGSLVYRFRDPVGRPSAA